MESGFPHLTQLRFISGRVHTSCSASACTREGLPQDVPAEHCREAQPCQLLVTGEELKPLGLRTPKRGNRTEANEQQRKATGLLMAQLTGHCSLCLAACTKHHQVQGGASFLSGAWTSPASSSNGSMARSDGQEHRPAAQASSPLVTEQSGPLLAALTSVLPCDPRYRSKGCRCPQHHGTSVQGSVEAATYQGKSHLFLECSGARGIFTEIDFLKVLR